MKALIAFVLLWQVDIPFKSADEFEVNIELKYKAKPDDYKPNSYSVTGNRMDKTSGVLSPFLIVHFTKLKIQADEVKMKAMDSSGKTIFRHKTSAEDVQIEMGFVDDLKTGNAANEVTIFFISAEKKEIRKITCTVLSDGTFQVNGKWHGKF